VLLADPSTSVSSLSAATQALMSDLAAIGMGRKAVIPKIFEVRTISLLSVVFFRQY
jgi:hypothetical protein